MKTGIRAHDITATGIENISDESKEYGIEYLQLVLERSIDGFATGNYTEEYAASIKKELKGSKIAVLGSYVNLSNPNSQELEVELCKFKEKIKYATILNPIVVGSETGVYINGKTNSEEAYQYLLKNVKELVAFAEKNNASVGIEGVHCFVINSPKMMKRLVDDVNSDNLKLIFDPVNLLNAENYINQREIIDEAFSLFADKIAVIHIKDFVIENGGLKTVVPFSGNFDFENLMKNVAKYNLDIPFICEEIDEKQAKETFEKLAKL